MAPTRVSVFVCPHSFDGSHGRPVTGPIWLRQGSRADGPLAFPGEDWVDFPVIVLGWWLAELGALRAGSGARICLFMDGPFAFTLTDAGRSLLRVVCVEHRVGRERAVAEWVTPATAFEASLRAAAESALAECDRRGWSDADIARLREAVSAVPYFAPAG